MKEVIQKTTQGRNQSNNQNPKKVAQLSEWDKIGDYKDRKECSKGGNIPALQEVWELKSISINWKEFLQEYKKKKTRIDKF